MSHAIAKAASGRQEGKRCNDVYTQRSESAEKADSASGGGVCASKTCGSRYGRQHTCKQTSGPGSGSTSTTAGTRTSAWCSETWCPCSAGEAWSTGSRQALGTRNRRTDRVSAGEAWSTGSRQACRGSRSDRSAEAARSAGCPQARCAADGQTRRAASRQTWSACSARQARSAGARRETGDSAQNGGRVDDQEAQRRAGDSSKQA